METKPSIVWFRQDMRIEDHPALLAAEKKGGAIVPLYIWCPDEEGAWAPGSASKWWLHYSLETLQKGLKSKGIELIIRSGSTKEIFKKLLKETEAEAVYWNRRYEPAIMERDKKIAEFLEENGVTAKSFNGNLLFEPWEIENKQGDPYQVFTYYWKECMKHDPPEPQGEPKKLIPYQKKLASQKLEELELLPKIPWDEGIRNTWNPGFKHAKKNLTHFLENTIAQYKEIRDRPDLPGASRLSPYLHYGEITPRIIWKEAQKYPKHNEYLRQIGWREFAHHLLYHFPKTPSQPLRDKFEKFPWAKSYKHLESWQKGKTGYPIVDAGMRQLWRTGWMHNRLRLIVGSFLVKDLMLPWQEGAKWFWDTLVDADLANNTLGWQWVAGCGADAAPYFRIFNPITQSEKFDPEGKFIRKWVPELEKLPTKHLHAPWKAPKKVLENANVELGKNYPKPIVDHQEARKKALEGFEKVKAH